MTRLSNTEAILSKLASEIRAWSIPWAEILNDGSLRFDATHYDSDFYHAVRLLKASGYELKLLSEIADVRLPGQFTRVWARNGFGYRYVNGTELTSVAGCGTNEKPPRYLSKYSKTKLEELLLREGMLVVTCSGTIGRVIYISKRFEGWAGTHDMIRVIPKSVNLIGYLYTYLQSPIAQAQIHAHTFGGTIDHISAQQLMTIVVPIIPEKEMEEINNRTLSALNARDAAVEGLTSMTEAMATELSIKTTKTSIE